MNQYPDSPKVNAMNITSYSPDPNLLNQNLDYGQRKERRATGNSVGNQDVYMNQIMLSQTSKANERTDNTIRTNGSFSQNNKNIYTEKAAKIADKQGKSNS